MNAWLRGRRWLLPASLLLVAFLTYGHILSYFWTGPDTFSLILTGRVQSLSDVMRILVEPLMNRAKLFPLYYRPLSTFSFSLDYAVWGLNPFGFHLTNLVLHCLVTVMLFLTVRSLHPARPIAAWLAGILYTSHPLMVEVVPGIERRQDMLAMLFLLATLKVMTVFHSTSGENKFLKVIGWTMYLLTLASKEIGVIFLPLFFLYVFLFVQDRGSIKSRLQKTFKSTRGFWAITVLYFTWWLTVAGPTTLSKGGLARQFIVKETVIGTVKQLVMWGWYRIYLWSLYPLAEWWTAIVFFRSYLERVWFTTGIIPILVSAGLCILFLVLVWRMKFPGKATRRRILRYRAIPMILAAMMLVLGVCIAFVPLLGGVGETLIRLAYYDPGLPWLSGLMASRQTIPIASYYNRLQHLLHYFGHLAVTGFLVTAVSLAGWCIWKNRHQYREEVGRSQVKWVMWYAVWTVLPGLVYTTGLSFAYRLVYPAILPVCIVLGLGTVRGLEFVVGFFYGCFSTGASSQCILSGIKHFDKIVLAALIVLAPMGVVRYSPLFEPYPEWNCAQHVTRHFLSRAEDRVVSLPDGAIVVIEKMPRNIFNLKRTRPRTHSAGIFAFESLTSWLTLKAKLKNRTIHIQSREDVRGECPATIHLRVKERGTGKVRLSTQWN